MLPPSSFPPFPVTSFGAGRRPVADVLGCHMDASTHCGARGAPIGLSTSADGCAIPGAGSLFSRARGGFFGEYHAWRERITLRFVRRFLVLLAGIAACTATSAAAREP